MREAEKQLSLQRQAELQEWSSDASKRLVLGYQKGVDIPKKLWVSWLYRNTKHNKAVWRVYVQDSAEGKGGRVAQAKVDVNNLAPNLQHLGSAWPGGAFQIWAAKYADHCKSQQESDNETLSSRRKRAAEVPASSPPPSTSAFDQDLEDKFFKNLMTPLDTPTLKKVAKYFKHHYRLSELPPINVLENARKWRRFSGERWATAPGWAAWLRATGNYPCHRPSKMDEEELDWSFRSSKRRKLESRGSPQTSFDGLAEALNSLSEISSKEEEEDSNSSEMSFDELSREVMRESNEISSEEEEEDSDSSEPSFDELAKALSSLSDTSSEGEESTDEDLLSMI